MALSLSQMQEIWSRAHYHAQVEVLALPGNPATPSQLQMAVRVCRVFRGAEKLRSDDRIELVLPVARKADKVAPGEPYLLLDTLRIGRLLEVFADGEPPLLNCVATGFVLLDAPTATATLAFKSPAAASEAQSGQHAWWKFWR
ncbi:MAG TPA: hypothetical protein VGD54_18985 [Steroidobacteraceae bacterium]